jgi:hypothetical protein
MYPRVKPQVQSVRTMAAPVTECENCARPDAELVEVHRVYVTPADADHPEEVTEVDATEAWCVSCVSQYPCRALGS